MKLQIKTLNRKSLVVDIEPSQTVYDLKKELCLYPDVGVQPEFQKLIYAGKILSNQDHLSVYNIDTNKFLVVMILKQPLEKSPPPIKENKEESSTSVAAEESSIESKPPDSELTPPVASATKEDECKIAPVSNAKKSKDNRDKLVEQIVSMGYDEPDVRRALEASFNNPERAIEYLIEGIPAAPLAEGEIMAADSDSEMSPMDVFGTDPIFQSLRTTVQQHPELIDAAIQQIGDANASLLEMIDSNQEEFLDMLINSPNDDDDEDEASVEGEDD
ncbi:UV excision repair protein RAD23 homolog A-like [Glossina fuscipes]|uniref:UV excision repair protein RAD23 homolog A-like n=1 Tax=Glossina fuscipes TaxID=7396 RepID=A0A9C5YV95_9MUSC|nr:UV excision repair protein RAD23 homolog A-like [Glossina fuscipes]KAI9589741.1 hypothetical protein GQX74_007909 [Glossina fuscipes]